MNETKNYGGAFLFTSHPHIVSAETESLVLPHGSIYLAAHISIPGFLVHYRPEGNENLYKPSSAISLGSVYIHNSVIKLKTIQAARSTQQRSGGSGEILS